MDNVTYEVKNIALKKRLVVAFNAQGMALCSLPLSDRRRLCEWLVELCIHHYHAQALQLAQILWESKPESED
jgi:hypothetical protein